MKAQLLFLLLVLQAANIYGQRLSGAPPIKNETNRLDGTYIIKSKPDSIFRISLEFTADSVVYIYSSNKICFIKRGSYTLKKDASPKQLECHFVKQIDPILKESILIDENLKSEISDIILSSFSINLLGKTESFILEGPEWNYSKRKTIP